MAMVSFKLACMVVMCLAVVGSAPAALAITCGQITNNLMPCLPYLTGGGTASQGCCAGVKSTVGAAVTTADRQAICNCMKTAAGAIPGVNDKNALSLPAQCGVKIPYKISTSTNCASIKF